MSFKLTIGKVSILAIDAFHNEAIINIHPILLERDYLKYVLPIIVHYGNKRTAIKGKTLNREKLERLLFPLPPLSEQKRIVAEIEKQLAKTRQLKEHIIANQQATKQLLKALLHQAFEVKEIKESKATKSIAKVVSMQTEPVNYANLVAEPAFNYAALNDNANNIKDKNLELAIVVEMIESKLGINYGEVALQKTVFNAAVIKPVFSKPYKFINHNFGTYSHELTEDLKNNQYLIKKKVKGKEVFAVNPVHKKKVLDAITNKDNKDFNNSIAKLLGIYELPFINKGTDKIELFNTVLKIMLDKKTSDKNIVYQQMKEWKIIQNGYTCKADKFTIQDTEQMIKLITNQGLIKI